MGECVWKEKGKDVVMVVDKVLSIEATPCFFKFWAFTNYCSKSYEGEMEMRVKKLVTK